MSTAHIEAAVGAIAELRERGLRIGHDVALVSFDDTRWFPLIDPPMTVIAQDVRRLGDAAFGTLLDLLAGRQAMSVTIPTRLVVRESCTTDSIPQRRTA